jgi:DNA processing protein
MASPRANKEIAEQILEKGGAWVSEHPLRVPPKPEYFVQRNRLQIGLSAGSIIVEGEEKSGTTSQAGFCVQEKRILFAVVPESTDNPLNLVSSGPQFLLRTKGAIPIKSREDYLAVLSSLQSSRQRLEARMAA